MLDKLSLKSQFQILVTPIMILALILVIFIGYSEYERGKQLQDLTDNITVIEDLRKLISLATAERELSIKLITLNQKKLKLSEKAILRDLGKQRTVVDTRIESVKLKLEPLKSQLDDKAEKVFLNNVKNKIAEFSHDINQFREQIDKNQISDNESMTKFTNLIKNIINLVASSSLDINDPIISKSVAVYFIYLKYSEVMSQRELLFSNIKDSESVKEEHKFQFKEVYSSLNAIKEIAESLSDHALIEHYKRLFVNTDVKDVDYIYSEIISTGNLSFPTEDQIKNYFKTMKELEDYLSNSIYTELALKADAHKKREVFITLAFLVSLLFILFSTYSVYNNMRETLFFGTIHIKSKILRVMADLTVAHKNVEKNEIRSLLQIVTMFADLLKETLSKIRMSFFELISLSNHLSASSEHMVKHIQRQSRHLQDTNFQMEMIQESIRSSEHSFDNIIEIIEDSTAKIGNLNIDVTYLTSELVSLKQMTNNLLELKALFEKSLSCFEEISSENQIHVSEIYKSIEHLVSNGEAKLTNLSKLALLIKRDAELNNANLNDILGVITALSYETKAMSQDIIKNLNESNNFIELSKETVTKSEYISSDVKMLNKYIINLDKEFNKFRF